MRTPILMSLVALASCVRAPPPIAPFASGGVAQAQDSSGVLVAGVGFASDLVTATGLSGSLQDRVHFSDHFDLGLGGSYGAAGYPKTWMGRVSPRFYLTPVGAKTVVALEVGLGAGAYEGYDLNVLATPQVRKYRVTSGSTDVLFRMGTEPVQGLEFFGGAGPFGSVGYSKTSCLGSQRCVGYQVGAALELGLQWSHSSGFLLGLQGNGSLGFAPSLFAVPVTFGALLTAGWRFGMGRVVRPPSGLQADDTLPPP